MKTRKTSGYFFNMLAALVLLMMIPGISVAAVPLTINYQGYLTSSGSAFDGTVDMTFSVYDVISEGSALWSEAHTTVVVTNGVYSVILGSVDPSGNPLNLPFDAQYYLGVRVDTDAEMTPRQQLTSVGYAINADTADFALDVADGAVTDIKISGVISSSKIDPAIATDIEVNAHANRTDNPHNVTAGQVGAAATIHDHDARYYTETEVDALLATRDGSIATLQTQVAELIDRLQHFSRINNDVYLVGANLHVRNTSNSTDGAVDGLGNIIIGWNEARGGGADSRGGSHNLVVGSKNNFSSYGGIVAGDENTISAKFSSVTGGFQNEAFAPYASVTGGSGNWAEGDYSSISGGEANTASGTHSSILGGLTKTTANDLETVPAIPIP